VNSHIVRDVEITTIEIDVDGDGAVDDQILIVEDVGQ
jgi:hypothetical protein